MEYRTEHDTMGEVQVPADHCWGAQTQRSLQNFRIGTETMPVEIIQAFTILKSACATANESIGKLDKPRAAAIREACGAIARGEYGAEFPLKIWQTGSGTQTNMNVNEVISHIAAERHPEITLHPNDHVNMSQSSNDTFPTAMYIAAAMAIYHDLLPALDTLAAELLKKENEYYDVIKIGRTHLQDAVPLTLGQEISGWRTMIDESRKQIHHSMEWLFPLAIGGTAVGTGLNAPDRYDELVCKQIKYITDLPFTPSKNKFHALTSKDGYVVVHGALKALAANLMKIANDIRWLSSGPRCGIGELKIPENEPGSSIMPGKVNPTQCEAITMIAVQVMGNDTTIGIAASQGNFELNVFMPVMAYNMHQSIRLLTDGVESFTKNCVVGIEPRKDVIKENLDQSLMLVTCLSPQIGYENAAAAAHKAYEEGTTLKEAVVSLGFLSEAQYDMTVRPERMVKITPLEKPSGPLAQAKGAGDGMGDMGVSLKKQPMPGVGGNPMPM